MKAPGSPVLIDGSHGEGGGALVRTALTMSALTQQPVRIDGVRTGTNFPGLDLEDLILLKALQRCCGAEVVGGEIGSSSFSFLPTSHPRALKGTLDIAAEDVRGRGANVPVVLNALLPVLARTGAYSQVACSGETYGNRSLSFDYFQGVTVPALRKMGLYASPDQEIAGFGRESHGRVTMDVEPSALQGLDWMTRGRLLSIRAIVTTAELPNGIPERALSHLANLAEHSKLPIEPEANTVDSPIPGAFVTIYAECERGMGGAAAMGQRGLRVETLVQRAFEQLLAWIKSDATVDRHLADQLLVAACLADTETHMRTDQLSRRVLTTVWVIKQFLPIHITVRGVEGEPGTISIER